eukprot:scaffold19252_cov117-Isochrysis_galbana.AAC.11
MMRAHLRYDCAPARQPSACPEPALRILPLAAEESPNSTIAAQTIMIAFSSKWGNEFTTKQEATARKNTKGPPKPSPALSPKRENTAYCRNGKGCLYLQLTSGAGPSSLNPESNNL